MAAYLCAEEGGGCGVMFTPDHDKRPRRTASVDWRWCPDCLLAQGSETAV